ncbi:hypothetical protein BDP27DRAFT_1402890 [Rhodocollybia butyracea]|uniref:GATA-type domain-containing protein n=1 Tax=Rhodocollybia butyracea TaxID=206335 RepID=A0A9P5U7N3_9AGAR|nr:hypothetical protein BDP27DRAFT_1402890 [Rhodocollybia butyracea]
MAAHHAAQRQHLYSIPPPPPPPSVFNDELRLPSIKDLAFKYERPRQEGPQSVSNAGQTATEYSVSASQERSRAHSQPWPRQTQPVSISTHHPQQQHTPPLSAGHELSSAKSQSAEYSPRHDSGGYLTPGMPLSAQTAPLPGSVNTGPAIRGDEHSQMQNKRPRTSSVTSAPPSRDSRPNHVVYQPQYQYQTTMPPPPSPYHQMSPVVTAPPQSSLPPSHMQHHQPSTIAAHPGYQYQQPQQPYIRSSPQNTTPHPPSSHPPHAYHPAPPQHSHAPQQLQAPPPPPSHSISSQPQNQHHSVPYPSHSPPVSQEHWEHPHQPQHSQPVHPVHHHPVQHVQHPPPPPPVAVAPAPTPMHHTQYSHPPPAANYHQQQQQPQHVPPPHSHTNYAQPANSHPPSQHHSLSRAVPPVVTTPVLATPEVDARTPYPTSSARESTMAEIVKLCSILYDFANRYASLKSALPHVQPSQAEVADMARRANEVVRLLEVLRRMEPEGDRHKIESTTSSALTSTPDDHRPPKRPWEDMAQDGQASGDDTGGMFPEPSSASAPGQTTAEQDMELIRSKRATTTAAAATSTGQPKSKYRKRSFGQRATPPGKCHSCNIRETPEWRRGPDGARTLCNACGLHYAKLMRKQSKANTQAGAPPPKIDLDTLKASTKAAEAEKAKTDENTAPGGATPHHHQSSFQVMTVMSPVESQSSTTPSDPGRLPAHHQTILPPPTNGTTGSMHPPPPPWAVNVQRTWTSSEQLQSQSFMRTATFALDGVKIKRVKIKRFSVRGKVWTVLAGQQAKVYTGVHIGQNKEKIG